MHGSLFLWISLVDDKPVVKESQTKGTGACVGADDAADLAHQRLGKAEIIDQIGLDGSHLAGADGVTGQRVEAGVDTAQLFDLLEEGDISAGQAAGLASHRHLALLEGDEGLDMFILIRMNRFHVVTVSICGGIIHNMGQLIVAGFLVSSYYVIYYMPVLLIAGFVTGALIGIVAKEVGGRLCIHISKANYPK